MRTHGTIARLRIFALCVTALAASPTTRGQNVVDSSRQSAVAPPISLDADAVRALLWRAPRLERPAGDCPEAARIRAKLDRHVRDFLDGFPFRSFHMTLGISGHESCFGHPDEMFWALSLAVPVLPDKTATRVRDFLRRQLTARPPWEVDGFEHRAGRPRESYAVPDHLRSDGRARATNAFGVYALWAWTHWAGGGDELTPARWRTIRSRMEPILANDYRFDIRRHHERDEAEQLNGDLAGVIGCLRLARGAGDKTTESRALSRAVQMLALRINLERVNPRLLEASKTSASHSLHAAKLARWIDLAPCVGFALRELTDGVAVRRLAAFREARNAWHVAFGPRLIGGENYTSPPHFSRALFDAAVFVEWLDARQISSFVDVEWCRGDYYLIAKCVWALWALEGRKWDEDVGNR